MAKLAVVAGATGNVGGSVARQLLKDGWKVRGITRNVSSASAKALPDAGAEFTSANYDDGANAVFGVTNIFEYLLDGTPEQAAERETNQIVNIAKAVAKSKDKAADIIKETLPDIAGKITFLWIGMFSSNFAAYPMMKPFEIPGSYGSHTVVFPISADSRLPFGGDVTTNVGVFVGAILAKPDVSRGKAVLVKTEDGTLQEYVQPFIDVTGRRTTILQVSLDQYEQIYGPYGKELGLMFKALGSNSDWAGAYSKEYDFVDAQDLGIDRSKLVKHAAAVEKDKDKF
ncbi:hypothetical protein B0A48_15461 [Cryoendolithus antarcticus]|uniref:NmrA-like domain-containing protein n=1 Tax=Cryoendolithus antarcticus TaxID=1507870 RepID=A0A1V8SGC9_9PEZI|nr:hypothetical protein B0A48_15461 [Cryoendolithus antarcticus]